MIFTTMSESLNHELFLQGMELLAFYGDVLAITDDGISVLGVAKRFMTVNPDRFLTEYAGAKRFPPFHQISNHKYGYGPSHGYIVASIGLKNRRKESLSDDEKTAISYALEKKAVLQLGKTLH